MHKYKNHQEFGSNAPINWQEKATSEVYLEGLSKIAPEGMKPRVRRGQQFATKTGKPESAKWHHNYDLAMFGGTEISQPDVEPQQMPLEGKTNGIPRIPDVRRR